MSEVLCGSECKKPLKCGRHGCTRECHVGEGAVCVEGGEGGRWRSVVLGMWMGRRKGNRGWRDGRSATLRRVYPVWRGKEV